LESDPLCLVISSFSVQPLTAGIVFSIIAVMILLFFSALVSGSEVAFFSLSPAEIKRLQASDSPKSKIILQLLSKPEQLLANILIANNFINIAIVILSAHISTELFNFGGNALAEFLFQVVVITFFLLLFGEIIPKVYSTHAGMKFARFTSYPVFFTTKLFSPFSSLLVKSSLLFEKQIKRKQGISVEDLSDAIELAGSDIEDDKKILEGIVSFKNIEVKEIMKPRIDVISAHIETDFSELIMMITDSGYSRIPVYKLSPDNIEGIIYAKDLLPHLHKDSNYEWQNHIRPAYYVPESMRINDLLEQFRIKKIHMAIVSDEYGGVPGIVTLEDIIEEIVGEITDETDEAEDNFLKIGPNIFEFDAKIQINDFYKLLDIKEDIFAELRKESDSVAGIILELEHKIPPKGDIIQYKNLQFTILDADARRIKRIRLKIT
jgi:gliding motility-associated protein GldE